jgi:hypothetical protein
VLDQRPASAFAEARAGTARHGRAGRCLGRLLTRAGGAGDRRSCARSSGERPRRERSARRPACASFGPAGRRTGRPGPGAGKEPSLQGTHTAPSTHACRRTQANARGRLSAGVPASRAGATSSSEPGAEDRLGSVRSISPTPAWLPSRSGRPPGWLRSSDRTPSSGFHRV